MSQDGQTNQEARAPDGVHMSAATAAEFSPLLRQIVRENLRNGPGQSNIDIVSTHDLGAKPAKPDHFLTSDEIEPLRVT